MEYEQRVCCFLDILGFKEHIEETINNGKDNYLKIQEIQKIISFIQELIYDLENGTSQSKMVTHFSDSVVISFRIEEKSEIISTLVTLLYVAFECANKGFFIRGGVSFGKLIHTNTMVFGPALNEAYLLESKKAIFPRIIMNKEILKYALKYRKELHTKESLGKSLQSLVVKDEDGEFYIEYMKNAVRQLSDPEYDLLEYINNLQRFISRGLNHKSDNVVRKYEWLKKKYNAFLEPLLLDISNNKIVGEKALIDQYKKLRLL